MGEFRFQSPCAFNYAQLLESSTFLFSLPFDSSPDKAQFWEPLHPRCSSQTAKHQMTQKGPHEKLET